MCRVVSVYPYWLVSLLTFIPLMSVDVAASRLNRSLAPASSAVAPWSTPTIIVAVLFSPIAVFAIVDTLSPGLIPE